jgi:hypothetical protein
VNNAVILIDNFYGLQAPAVARPTSQQLRNMPEKSEILIDGFLNTRAATL